MSDRVALLVHYTTRHVRAIVGALALSLCAVALGPLQALSLGQTIDSFTDERVDLAATAVLCLAMVGAALANSAANYLQSKIGNQVLLDLRRDLLAAILQVKLDHYYRSEYGDLLHRVMDDASEARTLVHVLVSAFQASLTAVTAFTVMTYLDWALTLQMLAMASLAFVLYERVTGRLADIHRSTAESAARLTIHMERSIVGIRSIRAAATEDVELARFQREASTELGHRLRYAMTAAFLAPAGRLLVVAALVIAIGFGVWRLATSGLDTAAFVAFLALALMFLDALSNIGDVFVHVRNGLVSVDRVRAVLNLPSEEKDGKDLEVDHRQRLPRVHFSDVCFRHASDSTFSLRDISFEVPAGTLLAVTGPSGSGKSTLLELLDRFHDPTGGRILINDEDLATLARRAFRRTVAFVEQTPYMLAGTLRDNLVYGHREKITDSEIADVLAQTRLAYLQGQLSRGIDTDLGERGLRLSGGERQRLAIARAMLRNASLFLLDEVTSDLGHEDATLVLQIALELRERATVVMATHDPWIVERADQVIELEAGQIVRRTSNALI